MLCSSIFHLFFQGTSQCRHDLLQHCLTQLLSAWRWFFHVFLHPWKLTWHWKIPMFNRKNIFKSWIFFLVILVFGRKKSLNPQGSQNGAYFWVEVSCSPLRLWSMRHESIFDPKRSKTNHRSLTASFPLKRSVVFQDEPFLLGFGELLNFGGVVLSMFFYLFVDDFRWHPCRM